MSRFVDLSFGRYDGPGTTHVIFVLYLDDATFIFQEPHRVHVITSLSSSTLPVYKINPWISTTLISITPLLRRRERKYLDLTQNPTSTELRLMH
jgi:hypothetical protein